ncbi:MAG: protein kinase [Nitrospinae bacterium]|nr:protein kinase [Nitrospinota bacterium]
MEIKCPSCGAKYPHVDPSHVGKSATCKKCGAKFKIESQVHAAPQPEQPSATVAFGEPASQPSATVAFSEPANQPSATVAFEDTSGGPGGTVAFEDEASPLAAAAYGGETVPGGTMEYDEGPAITLAGDFHGGAGLGETIADFGTYESPAVTAFMGEDGEAVAGGEESVPADWATGDVILGLYEVSGLLGEGGMGKVFKVRHLGWNLDLAVKCPRQQELLKAGGAENFEREAETWVNLGLHPNVVSCYYVRRLGGSPRVFAEFIDGGSMQDWIRGGKLSDIGHILDVAIQFAWGLAHSHEQGLVHQDIKPANVMMTSMGVAKVTDFGLARARAASDAGGSELVGASGMTPAYCSPEQALRSPLSRKTDIWSWAASVLEIFTGEVTWMSGVVAGEALEEFLKGGGRAGAPVMPDSLAELLRWCFKNDPVQRPEDMMAVADVLREIYRKQTGSPYPRPVPKIGKSVADSLNNRAVSLLDLGRLKEAEELWNGALQSQPHHPESTFNRGVVMWRMGRLSDTALVKHMEEALRSHRDEWECGWLLGLTHLERDDVAAAQAALKAVEPDGGKGQIDAALALAEKKAPNARGITKTQPGHEGAVTAVAISLDGKTAVTAGDDKTIAVWDLGKFEKIKQIPAAQSSITALSLGQDGGTFLAAGHRTMALWDMESGEKKLSFDGHTDWVTSATISKDGSVALSSGWDNTLRIWDAKTGRLLREIEGAAGYSALSADGKLAVCGSMDNTVKVWDAASGELVRELQADAGPVALSYDGKLVFTCGLDNVIRVWDLESGSQRKSLAGHTGSVTSVNPSPNGRTAVSSGYDRTVRLWDLRTGRVIRTFEGFGGVVNSVSVSQTGAQALCGAWNGAVSLLRLESPAPYFAPMALCRVQASETVLSAGVEYETKVAEARKAMEKGDFPDSAALIRQARAQAGYSRGKEACELWRSIYIKQPRAALKGGWESLVMEDHASDVASVDISRDGSIAVSGGLDRSVKLWSMENGSLLGSLEGHTDRVNCVALGNDGMRAISGSGDWTCRIWDVEKGETLRTLKGHKGPVYSARLSSDGVFAVTGGGDGDIKLWGVASGSCARTFGGHSSAVRAVAISQDGQMIISGSDDKSVRIWDPVSGDCLEALGGQMAAVLSVAIGFTGDKVYAGSANGDITVWNAMTGELIRKYDASRGAAVNSITPSLDGRHFVTGGGDGKIRFWDAATGEVLRVFEGHSAAVNSVSASWDMGMIVSGGADRMVKGWTLDWEVEAKKPGAWDEGAEPFVKTYLVPLAPYSAALPEGRAPFENEVVAALTKAGKPASGPAEAAGLMFVLGCAGFGHINDAEVSRKLAVAAVEWQAPAPPDKTMFKSARVTQVKAAEAEDENIMVTYEEEEEKEEPKTLFRTIFRRKKKEGE